MHRTNRDSIVTFLVTWGVGGILLIAPFYAPITVMLASHLEHFDLLRIWKEIALTAIGIAILYFLFTHYKQAKYIVKERLFQIIIAYALLLCGVALYDLLTDRVAVSAVIYGLMIQLRLVGFFMVVYIAFRTKQLNDKFAWWKFALIPAVGVVVFGLMQMTILPDDSLRYIGYSSETIIPFQTVDNNPDFVRVQSTLRGPNPLGAYLLFIITLTTTFIVVGHRKKYLKQLLLFLVCSILVLLGTYSRSALLGTILALIVLVLIRLKLARWFTPKKMLLGGLVITSIILILGALLIRRNYIVETIVFHSNTSSQSPESSNSQRSSALQGATKEISEHPFGGGVGSAGPASFRNNGKGKIAENYFLQIGQEVGVLGMALFLIINAVIAMKLYRLRATVLGSALFASLAGLTFVNMLSHAWADDTLAYIWWGLAGIALAHQDNKPAILNKKRKHDEAQEKRSKRTHTNR